MVLADPDRAQLAVRAGRRLRASAAAGARRAGPGGQVAQAAAHEAGGHPHPGGAAQQGHGLKLQPGAVLAAPRPGEVEGLAAAPRT